jgi:small-conductance mechanosensitive channel
VASLAGACAGPIGAAAAEPPPGRSEAAPEASAADDEALPAAAAKVDVEPVAKDEQIRERIQSVLEATGWLREPGVRVDQGVVFLSGTVETEDVKKWAGELARNTEGVVAVANRMEVLDPSFWDLRPAWSGLASLWRDFVRALPYLFFGLLILALSAGASVLATRGAGRFLRRRVRARLLRDVMARAAGVLVLLFGVYVVLRVSGLTQLALTVIGGTGLIGLAVGIAFRDITENFLASILLSMQRPFETGDLVEVGGVTGYVQQLNVRTTVLMTLDGVVVQVPNASVYKSNLRNFTANANRRDDFVVGIGYEDSIAEAQEIALQVLLAHPAVLDEPEPWVLVDALGRATIDLRVYFWLDGSAHSWLKVRSSVIRLVKRAFQEHGITMPDEAREVVFPRGVPIRPPDAKAASPERAETLEPPRARAPRGAESAPETRAEGGLSSEANVIEGQARQVAPLNEEENLLKGGPRRDRRERGSDDETAPGAPA